AVDVLAKDITGSSSLRRSIESVFPGLCYSDVFIGIQETKWHVEEGLVSTVSGPSCKKLIPFFKAAGVLRPVQVSEVVDRTNPVCPCQVQFNSSVPHITEIGVRCFICSLKVK